MMKFNERVYAEIIKTAYEQTLMKIAIGDVSLKGTDMPTAPGIKAPSVSPVSMPKVNTPSTPSIPKLDTPAIPAASSKGFMGSVQGTLNKMNEGVKGYTPLAEDNIFGDKTNAALGNVSAPEMKNLQTKINTFNKDVKGYTPLKVDGIYGGNTMNAIKTTKFPEPKLTGINREVPGLKPTDSLPSPDKLPAVNQSIKTPAWDTPDFTKKIQGYENNKKSGFDVSGWNDKTNLFTPHKSLEGGTNTLAWGHKLTAPEVESGMVNVGGKDIKYSDGLTDEQSNKLLKQDIGNKVVAIKKDIPKFDTFPGDVQQAMINGYYRGDLSGSPTAIKHINAGEWDKVAPEYLNHGDFTGKDAHSGVIKRMQDNANVYSNYAKILSKNK
jgi:hypothetical protein